MSGVVYALFGYVWMVGKYDPTGGMAHLVADRPVHDALALRLHDRPPRPDRQRRARRRPAGRPRDRLRPDALRAPTMAMRRARRVGHGDPAPRGAGEAGPDRARRWAEPPDDPDNYLVLARALAEGRGYVINGVPTAYRPPAVSPDPGARSSRRAGRRPTPALLGLNLAPGVGTIALTALAARRWGLSERGDPARGGDRGPRPGPGLARAIGDDGDARRDLPVAATFALLAGRRGALLGGLGFGLLALCRPSLLPAAGLCAWGRRSAGRAGVEAA